MKKSLKLHCLEHPIQTHATLARSNGQPIPLIPQMGECFHYLGKQLWESQLLCRHVPQPKAFTHRLVSLCAAFGKQTSQRLGNAQADNIEYLIIHWTVP